MRAVVQRVHRAAVAVDGKTVGSIGKGLLVLVGVGIRDTEADLDWMCDKIINLRIFEDENGKMNLSLLDVKGELLVVSQFTLYGDCRKGRRPSFSEAAPVERGKELYDLFVKKLKEKLPKVEQGIFGAHMEVELVNDGPVTLLLDSERKF
ncbi:D-aminoacyl-tRNA deacylase [Pseudothermotoga thermarum]|uniref:D-aminoacyl-tRNA deacylase n=1 Tax=Pseudothermotoga thermarum DSM 5069 TaxID=688269 RepID=F7YYU4_9THEM|nr:D-aminoacyl-tRNA deacylase [Pseudothermotoga thermarum]AEH51133.1 D-tyrosyl-tRNA(Tyr) deacylase [Pseudothermotoga thermarum DSM 5069]